MALGFSINDAVDRALSLNLGRTENLSEPDTRPPSLSGSSMWISEPEPASIVSASSATSPLSRAARDKHRSKTKRHATRSTKVDALLGPRPHHSRHYTAALPTIKAKFDLRKARIAATGRIGLRDGGISPEEMEAGAEEEDPSPTHALQDLFGPRARFHGFHLAKYLGPCVFDSRIPYIS